MPTLPLRDTLSVTLDGSGNGTIRTGPTSHRETWRVSTVSVKCSATVTTGACEARLYVGNAATDPNFRDNTFSGDTGAISDVLSDEDVRLPNAIIITWTGGVAGSIATAILTGSKDQT